MKSIEEHIEHDKDLIEDPKTSEPMKRHAKDELFELQEYVGLIRKRLKQEIIMTQMP